ncbi:MAG: hypothetical protein HYT09_02260 [Candidatus Levybacteria bacterium]|nr:hypothetical protein [Candidatus Levybacteria bacterium]
MLTKMDLEQLGKLVRKVVREEVEAEVKDATHTLGSDIRASRMQVQHDISELDDRMKNVEIRVDGSDKNVNLIIGQLDKIDERLIGVEKDVKDIKKRVKKTNKTVDVMIDISDKDIVGLRKRVGRIEEHLRI